MMKMCADEDSAVLDQVREAIYWLHFSALDKGGI